MKKIKPAWVTRGWIAAFGIWLLVLSGMPALWTEAGRRGAGVFPPGMIQAMRLHRHVLGLQLQLKQEETKLLTLDRTHRLMEQSPIRQEREIRRALGYVGPHEWVVEIRPSQKGEK